ncbi:LOW QUALITY PROTEIN: tachykinin-like peptides receptor 99D [Uloborus diversus]|uniref:LOW QUALITY PROTEIN: tachykinin-like peptides receptor 99D n=1 Tax=Uloborus diversus TaxID=327109 RepID=UPI0024094124|nr:LOW QUALITY PROTEIN: tachykinin-like peptides receptor 99D [Uloborus diversus]
MSILIDNDISSADNLYEVPIVLIILLSCCYGMISLTAIVGNFCVLLIVAISRRMRTVTNYFIANLAVADIVIGLFCIPFQFQAALLQRWVLPPFMCAFCPFVQVLSVNVSVFSLAAIALDRYRAVIYPLKAKTSKVSAKWIIVCIWIFSGISGMPYAIALRVTLIDTDTGNFSKPFCHNVGIPTPIWNIYNHALVCLQYFVPLSLISMMYIRIGLKLKDTKTPGNREGIRDDVILKNKKKVIHMLFVVVTLFGICWLPLQSYNILQEVLPQINKYKYINIIWFFCHWLAMSNSCYNPFIYAIYNERFKSEFRNRFGCCNKIFRLQHKDQKSLDSLSSRYA